MSDLKMSLWDSNNCIKFLREMGVLFCWLGVGVCLFGFFLNIRLYYSLF